MNQTSPSHEPRRTVRELLQALADTEDTLRGLSPDRPRQRQRYERLEDQIIHELRSEAHPWPRNWAQTA